VVAIKSWAKPHPERPDRVFRAEPGHDLVVFGQIYDGVVVILGWERQKKVHKNAPE